MNGTSPQTEADLEERLSRPTAADIAAMTQLDGDLVMLGAGGKMGPSLVRLARRASDDAGVARRIIAVSRFREPGVRDALTSEDIDAISLDLLEPGAVDRLPDAPLVIFMAGHKFGTARDPAQTWALNAFLPGLVARRYATSRLVVFSTGNVYPLVPVTGAGSTETDPPGPNGEYAQSAAARERVVSYLAASQGMPTAMLRLNYAVELRYGVLRDLADRIRRSEPIDLTMGHVNLIWQRDANSIALRCLANCAVPPFVLNVTGPAKLRVRDLAERLGERLGIAPSFSGCEADTALLSDASLCRQLFGPPTVDIDTLIDWVAGWVQQGGRSFGKPTHFAERDGEF